MYTYHDQLRAIKAKLEKCDGICKNCKYCEFVTDRSGLYYAFSCHHASEYFYPLSDTMKDLKTKTLEAIDFELS